MSIPQTTATEPKHPETSETLVLSFPSGGAPIPLSAPRSLVVERGVRIEIGFPQQSRDRIILYDRLTGEAARQRAITAAPEGAGLTPDEVARVEYAEVWSTPDQTDGYDLRLYSFGGVLIASCSTRGH